jgi:hypothetical protein
VEVVQNHDAGEDVVVAGGGLFAQMGQVLAQFLTGFVVDAEKKPISVTAHRQRLRLGLT